jgi:DNA-binding transcriptional MocR family regulator
VATRTPPEGRALTLGPAAPTTRRAVGPIAWCVLEHLAETAEHRAGNTVSYESVRSTAGALGFANDTVARALRRLADAGLITYVPSRAVDGRFASSHYRLTLPANVLIGLPVPTPVASANRSRRSSSRPHPADATQLSLIDAVRHTT